jgi:hypothetical protein
VPVSPELEGISGRTTRVTSAAEEIVVTSAAEEIVVRLSKRAQNPLWKESGLRQRTGPVPWLAGRWVRRECP